MGRGSGTRVTAPAGLVGEAPTRTQQALARRLLELRSSPRTWAGESPGPPRGGAADNPVGGHPARPGGGAPGRPSAG